MPLRSFHSPGAGFDYRLRVALLLAAVTLLAALVIQLLLPWLLAGGLVGAVVWGWRRKQARDYALHQVFYTQLAAHGGRLSVLDFAIAAQITGSEARRFLDQRAQEFWGDFEPTATGDVLYTFAPPQAPPAPAPAPPVPGPVPGRSLSLAPDDLAQRLQCSAADLAQQRLSPTFAAWSRDRDPDSCGWRYDAGGDRYWPAPLARPNQTFKP